MRNSVLESIRKHSFVHTVTHGPTYFYVEVHDTKQFTYSDVEARRRLRSAHS